MTSDLVARIARQERGVKSALSESAGEAINPSFAVGF